MMAVKLKIQSLIVFLLLASFVLQGCRFSRVEGSNPGGITTPEADIPTWTPRSQDLTQTALPTATLPAPISTATPLPPTSTATPVIVSTPKTVSVTIKGGNLFVHRGPSLYYNFVGVLYDGETTVAVGRDLVSRWIKIKFPKKPDMEGWITTETKYTIVEGDISNLPFVETEPAAPAFIRNCTKHEIWILPEDVYLLSKYDKPDNEEQFAVGIHQVYDVDIPGNVRLEDVSLSEGETVDVRYDGTGDKSKCE